MKRELRFPAVLATMFCLALAASAQANLLTSPSFESPALGGAEDANAVPTGWQMDEGTLFTPGANTAQINHFGIGHTGAQAIWYRAFEGGEGISPAFADVYQDVAGTAGIEYELTGWALFESFYAGGVSGSPTDTVFAIDFLDGADGVLASASVELLANGQASDEDNGIPDEWMQHSVSGVAPAGTVTVRARASMIDGVSGTENPQSLFVDDLSLTAVPEPGTIAIALLALAGVAARRRVG